ncbi:MAG: glucose 1-dehydrogenase [Pseudomonadota bacterium]
MRLENKIAIVTGGASGFGLGITQCYIDEGAKVLIADIDAAKAESEAARLGANAAAHQVDVTDSAAVKVMIEAAKSTFGGLDIMVANAGLGQRPCPLDETSDEEYDRQFDVNVKGMHYCCKHAVEVFKAQGHGNIIVTASGIALMPRPNLVVYGATKGAVLVYAKGLAMELAPLGIRVNALCPAAGDTPMLQEFMGGQETSDKKEAFRTSMPMGRFITPEDMGHAAVYLASDREAGAITGTALAVDGGRTI